MKAVTLSTTTQVAEKYQVDPSTVRDWANRGFIPVAAKTRGGHFRFDLEAVDSILSPSTPTARPVDDPPVSAGRASSVSEGRA